MTEEATGALQKEKEAFGSGPPLLFFSFRVYDMMNERGLR